MTWKSAGIGLGKVERMLCHMVENKFEIVRSQPKVGEFPGGSDSKASAYNAGDLGLIPGSGRSGEVNGNPLQYSCLENPMDGGAWWATVHRFAKSRTRLSGFTFTFMFVCTQPFSHVQLCDPMDLYPELTMYVL